MGMTHYLAMTGAEFQGAQTLPAHPAWMACHFSPYGLGLSNLPKALPPGALLILDDVTPIRGHDPALIADQLQACLEDFGCTGLLLDFQRKEYGETKKLAAYLVSHLPCPVGVCGAWSEGVDCPVFLPPPPYSVPLRDFLAPWQGREIWLETALGAETVTLTEDGSTVVPDAAFPLPESSFPEEALHCHYAIDAGENAVTFRLWRTEEDLRSLLSEAEGLGVSLAVGLYQELSEFQL